MSTKRDTKYAAKRRATARKRNRELGRYIFTYLVLAILIVGTVSTVFVAQSSTSTPVTSSSTAVPTTTVSTAIQSLVTQADQDMATGTYTDAISLYGAYLQQVPSDAEVNYKLGKAYLAGPNPNIVTGLDYLTRATNISPNASWAADANALVQKYEPAGLATVSAMTTATAIVSGTTSITGTVTTVVTGTTLPAGTTAPSDQAPPVPATNTP